MRFFVFFLFVLCSSKYWPFYFPLSSCHRWVYFTSQWTPNYANQLFCLITSRKCYVLRKIAVLWLLCYCSMWIWVLTEWEMRNLRKMLLSDRFGEQEAAEMTSLRARASTCDANKERHTRNIREFTCHLWMIQIWEISLLLLLSEYERENWYSAAGISAQIPQIPMTPVTVLLTVTNVMQLVTPCRGSG